MFDFGYFYNNVLTFIGQVFGVFAWLGEVSYKDFNGAVVNLWGGGDIFQYVNVITGAIEVFHISAFASVVLFPFIAAAQLTVTVFNALMLYFSVPFDIPMWFVCSFYLFIVTTFMGLIRGAVVQFVKISSS